MTQKLLAGGIAALIIIGTAATLRRFATAEKQDKTDEGRHVDADARVELQAVDEAPVVADPQPMRAIVWEPPAVVVDPSTWTTDDAVAALRALPRRQVQWLSGAEVALITFTDREPQHTDWTVLEAVTLYTAGHVPAVVNPDNWSNVLASDALEGPDMEVLDAFYDQYVMERTDPAPSWPDAPPDVVSRTYVQSDVSKGAYERAHAVMTRLANAPRRAMPALYRGLGVGRNVMMGVQQGSYFSMEGLSSWSMDQAAAANFADPARVGAEVVAPVMLVCQTPSKGSPLYEVSPHLEEYEWICGGEWVAERIYGPEQKVTTPAAQLCRGVLVAIGDEWRVRPNCYVVEVRQVDPAEVRGHSTPPLAFPSRWTSEESP